MKLSVILPIKGNGPFLEKALTSISYQAIQPDEVLVINDGMGTPAKDILSATDLPIRMIEGPKTGPAAARNLALAQATGEYVAFIDDDDVWPRQKLSLQLARLEANPREQASGGSIVWFKAWNEERDLPVEDQDVGTIFHVNLGAFVFRRAYLTEVGGLDSSLLFSEDVDLVLRMLDANTEFWVLNTPTLYYRRHNGSMTSENSLEERRDFSKVLLRSIKRRPRQLIDRIARLSRSPFD
ncbi:MAG: glycosyltransferase family A protein, partial [Pseudomonadota bacterium]